MKSTNSLQIYLANIIINIIITHIFCAVLPAQSQSGQPILSFTSERLSMLFFTPTDVTNLLPGGLIVSFSAGIFFFDTVPTSFKHVAGFKF